MADIVQSMAPSDAPDDRRDAFVALFETHWGDVYRFARRRLRGDDAAHDVAAETFTVAWRRLDSIPAGHALPWLYRTAGNVLANRARTARRQDRLSAKLDGQPRPIRQDPGDAVIENAALADAFASLDDDARELLRLVAWEGLSHADIAGVLGVSTNAVALRVSRARRAFEDALADLDAPNGPDGSDATGRVGAGHEPGDHRGRTS